MYGTGCPGGRLIHRQMDVRGAKEPATKLQRRGREWTWDLVSVYAPRLVNKTTLAVSLPLLSFAIFNNALGYVPSSRASLSEYSNILKGLTVLLI